MQEPGSHISAHRISATSPFLKFTAGHPSWRRARTGRSKGAAARGIAAFVARFLRLLELAHAERHFVQAAQVAEDAAGESEGTDGADNLVAHAILQRVAERIGWGWVGCL